MSVTFPNPDPPKSFPPVLVRVPMAPPHGLSPNRVRLNPAAPRIKSEWRKAWYWSAVEAVGHTNDPRAIQGPVTVKITYWKGKRAKSWDQDNLIATCKHGFDQLQEARVIVNDRQIARIEVEQLRAPDGIGRLDVLITPLEEE